MPGRDVLGSRGVREGTSGFFLLLALQFLVRVPLAEHNMKPAGKKVLEITTVGPLRFKHIRGQERKRHESKQASDWQSG